MTFIYYNDDGVIKMASEGKNKTTLYEAEVENFNPPENSVSLYINGQVIYKNLDKKNNLINSINKAKDLDELKAAIINNL